MDKRIPQPGFAGDQGGADPRLVAAVQAYARDAGRLPDVLAALHLVRVLAPVVAVLGEVGTTDAGLAVEKSADIALPLLIAGEGHRAVPVFGSLDALARWDPAARPVPVEGPRAAQVALAEGAEALVLDLAGPTPVTLGLPEVRALAEGRGRVPAYDDETLRVHLHRALADLPEVVAGWLGPVAGADARLTVALRSGVPADAAAREVADAVRGVLGSAGPADAAADRPRTGGAGWAGVRGVELAVTESGAPDPPGRRVYTRRPA